MKLPLLVRTIQYCAFILCLLSFSIAASAQDLTKTEIIQIRKIQQLLLTSPKQAYAEALKLKQSKKGLASDCGDYYVACSFYTENQYAKSKSLLQKLLVEIDQNPVLNQQKGYQDLMGMCVNKLFYIYKNLGEYNQALDLLQAYKQKIPSDRYQQQFGIIKIAMGNYAEGIELLKLDLHNSKHLKLGVAEKKAMNDKLFADKNNEIGEAYQKYY
ncbi:MAG: tetratricopeptide repeat protein, partial [Flavobacterium stagni]